MDGCFPALGSWPAPRLTRCRHAGLSAAKAQTLPSAARIIADGILSEGQFEALPTPGARGRLQELAGIGPWTADAILLRGLGRLDVFPRGDVSARRNLAALIDRSRRSPCARRKSCWRVWAKRVACSISMAWPGGAPCKECSKGDRLIIFTIGHATRPIDEFRALLRGNGVRTLVDIRTIPRSRHNPQFSQQAPEFRAWGDRLHPRTGVGRPATREVRLAQSGLAQPVIPPFRRLYAHRSDRRQHSADARPGGAVWALGNNVRRGGALASAIVGWSPTCCWRGPCECGISWDQPPPAHTS